MANKTPEQQSLSSEDNFWNELDGAALSRRLFIRRAGLAVIAGGFGVGSLVSGEDSGSDETEGISLLPLFEALEPVDPDFGPLVNAGTLEHILNLESVPQPVIGSIEWASVEPESALSSSQQFYNSFGFGYSADNMDLQGLADQLVEGVDSGRFTSHDEFSYVIVPRSSGSGRTPLGSRRFIFVIPSKELDRVLEKVSSIRLSRVLRVDSPQEAIEKVELIESMPLNIRFDTFIES